jgi:hypothetical protein
MKLYIGKTKKVWYHYKTINFHPMISESLQCICKDGKCSWILMVMIGNEYIHYNLKNKQEVRDTIKEIKEKYDWVLEGE